MELLEVIKESGIVGAGGAGFPTHAKLSSRAEYILLNGAECEPLLRVDQQLMERYPDEIIKGFLEAGKLVDAGHGLIGVKGKHREVIGKLRERIAALGLGSCMEVKELPDIYPAGDEQILVYELTGRIVPEAGIPIQVGCVVLNAETALNIYKASQGETVTETYLTVAGDVPRRITTKVPVGTPVMEVLGLCGIENFEQYAVIDGGPMMGNVLENLDGYVTKKSKGYIVLKKDHPLIRKKTMSLEQSSRMNRSGCEQCRMCTDLCPRYLIGHNMQPHKIMRSYQYKLDDLEGQITAQLCCQCNLCQLFSCPAGLYPKLVNVYYKDKLAKEGIRYQPPGKGLESRSSRSFRLVPTKRLIARLVLGDYDRPAPMEESGLQPVLVSIAMSQHVGAPAVPAVAKGDKVTRGQLIGAVGAGSLGAAVHASIDGTVEQAGAECIVIRRNVT